MPLDPDDVTERIERQSERAYRSLLARLERMEEQHPGLGDRVGLPRPGPPLASKPGGPDPASRMMNGREWLESGGTEVEPQWGDTSECLAAKRQPTMVVGDEGAGKTTVVQAVVLAGLRVGGRESVLGHHVAAIEGKVLYLASDRPDQARLSMRRMVTTDEDMATLAQRLMVWVGPPPGDVAKAWTVRGVNLLLDLCRQADASMVVLDSAKDMAVALANDEVGSAWNTCIQTLTAEGIEVVVLHHTRKVSGDLKGKPKDINDVYGSKWLTAGLGSLLHIYVDGDEHRRARLEQWKSPVSDAMAPIKVLHDPEGGWPDLAEKRPDVLAFLRSQSEQWFGVTLLTHTLYGEAFTPAERKVIQRDLARLLADGHVQSRQEGTGTKAPKEYRAAGTFVLPEDHPEVVEHAQKVTPLAGRRRRQEG